MKSAVLLIFFVSAISQSKSAPRIDSTAQENLVTYHYRYAVDELQRRGPLMDRWEERLGEYVKGAYSVMQPDGRIRTVDYEVDGNKGYHAVIRMNQPGPELLSIQQLSQSNDIFPEAVLPTSQQEILLPPSLAPTSDTILNYHSKTPYYNIINSKVDHNPSANSQYKETVLPTSQLKSLPLSPANYNVPQTTSLIYFQTPAATIFHKTEPKSDSQIVQRDVKRQLAQGFTSELTNLFPTARKRRNSKLVRRYNSFKEVSAQSF